MQVLYFLYPGRVEIRVLAFCGERKTRECERKTLRASTRTNKNSTHIWHGPKLNHTGGRRVPSALRHLLFPTMYTPFKSPMIVKTFSSAGSFFFTYVVKMERIYLQKQTLNTQLVFEICAAITER